MTFLRKIQFIKIGEEDSVEINIQQIQEVFIILRSKGIRSPVTTGHRIHKSIQRPAGHHKERITDREFLTATKRGMFKNMRHTG